MPSPRTCFLASALALAACDDVPVDGVPCTRWETSTNVRVERVDELDLLLVLGGSRERARAFMASLPQMLESLSTGDLDGNGSLDVDGARSIHVGVITSDLGAGGHPVPGCVGGGDGGALRTEGDPGVPGCASSYPPFQVVERGGRPAADVAADLACVVPPGDRCTIDQPLESVLRTLSPASSAHAGFLRDGSTLAIVIVSDRDDCSVADPRLLDPDATELGELALRCGLHPELLHPIDRYVTAISAVRRSPRRLVLVSVAGAPPGVLPSLAETPSYESILAELEVRVDPDMPTRLEPACTDAIGPADPARRLVTVARDLYAAGATSTVRSICEPVDEAIDRSERVIADWIGGPCFRESLSVATRIDRTECTYTEVLPVGDRCADHPGRSLLRTTELAGGPEREECLLRRLTREQAIAGEAGVHVETADDPLPGSNLRELCGLDGTRVEVVGGVVIDSDIREYCPESIGPDGGTCH